MMTVKHILQTGAEYVYGTSHVNFVPSGAVKGNSGAPTPPDTVWRYDADGRAHPLTGGTVYVMNEHGKTVSRYDIGLQTGPVGIQPVKQPVHAPPAAA